MVKTYKNKTMKKQDVDVESITNQILFYDKYINYLKDERKKYKNMLLNLKRRNGVREKKKQK